MFEGLGFRILAMLVTVLTVVLGCVCVIAAWGGVILDQDRAPSAPSVKVPYALYTLTLAVLFQLAGLLVLLRIPYDFTERPIFGTGTELVVWSFFALASFALCVSSSWLAWKASGPATSLLRKSSILLLVIWVLGFLSYLTGD
jgi:hypothetical protein